MRAGSALQPKEAAMKTTLKSLRAAFCASLLFGATGTFAQLAYDPMGGAVNPLAPAAPAPQSGAPAAVPNPEFGDLPDGVGAEETYYQCIACHSTAIIRQQRLTDARWDYLWTWMVEEQGMYDAEQETKDVVMTYLKTHFSSER